jgi:quercetin dioxygenase-like cupin family protein
MKLAAFPLQTFDWNSLPATEHPGDQGIATWRTLQIGEVRVRLVQYSAGYAANHWCAKGHVVYCIAGEMQTTVRDGKTFRISAGMSYLAGDGDPPHRSETQGGATLFIVD